MGGINSSPSSLNCPSSRSKRKQYTGEYKNERKKIKSDKYAGVEKVEDMADFLTRLDLMDHTSEFFAKEDIASLTSLSKKTSKTILQTRELRCMDETVNGMSCATTATQHMSTSCIEWCKTNSLKKFYSLFELIEHSRIGFIFDNQPKPYRIAEVKTALKKTILLHIEKSDVEYQLNRYNEDRSYNDHDNSYSYIKEYIRNGSTYYSNYHYNAKIIRNKLEILVNRQFAEWGQWEIILQCGYWFPGSWPASENLNVFIPGTLFFEHKHVPCTGMMHRIGTRGQTTFIIHVGTMMLPRSVN